MAVIIWFICALACSAIAEGKGYNSTLWFILGIMFGIFSLGVVVFLPNNK